MTHLLRIVETRWFHVLVVIRQDFCFTFQKMNELEIFTIWSLHKRINRNKKLKEKGEFWIHPIVTLHDKEAFHTLFHHLKNFPSSFSIIFRC